jgi:low temperature requirement protein LtrA
VWWAWTQFTWALNAADTTHYFVELGTLLATGVAFFMAVSLPDAFHDRALWFATPYVMVRVIGLVLYGIVALSNPGQRAAVRTFATFSVGGLVMVLIGAGLEGDAQYAFWGLAVALDLVAASVGAQSEHWYLHTEHFVERHGLFVIIALGETLIVTASGLTGVDWTLELVLAGILSIAVTFGFWWSYFPVAKPRLEAALEEQTGARHSEMARDVFSVIHFPMLLGIIALAVAAEEVIAHPEETLAEEARWLLAAGLVLFVGGMTLATLRASGQFLPARAGLVLVTALAVGFVASSPLVTLAIAAAGVAMAAASDSFLYHVPALASEAIDVES